MNPHKNKGNIKNQYSYLFNPTMHVSHRDTCNIQINAEYNILNKNGLRNVFSLLNPTRMSQNLIIEIFVMFITPPFCFQ